jgi:hypothetical protein
MMNRIVRITVTAAALSLGLLLAGCDSFDPTAIFDAEIFNTKKKLPGERKPVFPEGTPGVSKGVPPELVKGYQPPPEEPPQAAVPEPKAEAKPKPKPKPKVAARPPAPAAEPQPQGQPPAQGQWPNPPARQPPQATAGGGWPSPPPSPGAQPSSGPAWPDPPPPPPR